MLTVYASESSPASSSDGTFFIRSRETSKQKNQWSKTSLLQKERFSCSISAQLLVSQRLDASILVRAHEALVGSADLRPASQRDTVRLQLWRCNECAVVNNIRQETRHAGRCLVQG